MTACADRARVAVGALAALLCACSLHRNELAPTDAAPAPSSAAGNAAPAPGSADAEADQRLQAALKLMKDKQYADATAALAALARDYPNLSGPLTDLGIVYAQTKKRDAAIDAFSHAVSASPDNAIAYNWLGALYRETGNFVAAENAYRRALAAHDDYAYAHYNLGILYDLYLNRPQDALDQYRTYLKLSGMDDLKVQAWIKALELKIAAASTAGAPQGSIP
jgi:tetratricopeptide (TPR) repeat protein